MRILFALLATALVAGALYWGFLRDDKTTAPAGMRVELDFSRLENATSPTTFDTGQEAVLSQGTDDPGSAFVVSDGRMRFAPTREGPAAAYLTTPDLGAPVTSLGAKWVFQPRGGTSGAMSLLVSRGVRPAAPPIVPPIPVHYVVTPTNWNFGVWKEYTSGLEVIAAGQFEQPLAQDGSTVYETNLEIDGSRVTINLPDGDRRIVNDPRISQWRGNFASFESYANNGLTDSAAAFEDVWATSMKDTR